MVKNHTVPFLLYTVKMGKSDQQINKFSRKVVLVNGTSVQLKKSSHNKWN